MINALARGCGAAVWMMARILFVYFVEIRWAVIIVKESVLHPMSASYVDVTTGKLVARYPLSGESDTKAREIPEGASGGINRSIAVCLGVILLAVALKVWLWWLG